MEDDDSGYCRYGIAERELQPAHTPPRAEYYHKNDENKKQPKRKRVMDSRQRMAANVRERRRMVEIRTAFDALAQRLPATMISRRKKLSRMEILHLSAVYIAMMTKTLIEDDAQNGSSRFVQ